MRSRCARWQDAHVEVTEFDGGADQSFWTFERQRLQKQKQVLLGHDAWTSPLTDETLGFMEWLLAQHKPLGPEAWAQWAREYCEGRESKRRRE